MVRVIRDNQGNYEVTVRRATDKEVLFVDPAGRLVRQQTLVIATTRKAGVGLPFSCRFFEK